MLGRPSGFLSEMGGERLKLSEADVKKDVGLHDFEQNDGNEVLLDAIALHKRDQKAPDCSELRQRFPSPNKLGRISTQA